ncbi:MAG: Holliday junction branch migration protein RuvA [Holosporales bacterium]|jgi:Holliday junction DNA helicase RuvA|nr:Holliday junction branch migration protein RuvA [Holosporales bacterium]
MIAKLRGVVDSILDDSILIDVHGICFQVFISSRCKESIEIGDDLALKILHIFKQENQILCGFQSDDEMRIFRALLDVQGIGIKSSLSILSTLSIEEIAMAVIDQDATVLCRAGGVGKKTAERILLELKGKTIPKVTDIGPAGNGAIGDAILGLVSLGYKKDRVIKVVGSIAEKIGNINKITTSEIIVQSLKELS